MKAFGMNCSGLLVSSERLPLHVRINPGLCNGCGLCQLSCPQVFALVKGKAVVIEHSLTVSIEDACFDAMEDCPEQAITIHEETSLPHVAA